MLVNSKLNYSIRKKKALVFKEFARLTNKRKKILSFIKTIFWLKKKNFILKEKIRIKKKIFYYLKKNNNKWKYSYLSLFKNNYFHFLHYFRLLEHTNIQNRFYLTLNIYNDCIECRSIASQFLKQYSNPKNRKKTQAEKLSILIKNTDSFIIGKYVKLFEGMLDYAAWDPEYLGHYANIFAVMELDTHDLLLTPGFGGYTELNQCTYEILDYIMEYIIRSLLIFECDPKPDTRGFFEFLFKRILIQADEWAEVDTDRKENDEPIPSFSLFLGEQSIIFTDVTYKDLFVALLYRRLRYFLHGKEYEEQFFKLYQKALPPGPNTEIFYQKPKLLIDYLVIEDNKKKMEYIEFYSSYYQESKKIIKEYLDTLGTVRLEKEKEREYYPLIVSHLTNIHTAPSFQKLYKKKLFLLKSFQEEKKKKLLKYYSKNTYIKQKKVA